MKDIFNYAFTICVLRKKYGAERGTRIRWPFIDGKKIENFLNIKKIISKKKNKKISYKLRKL